MSTVGIYCFILNILREYKDLAWKIIFTLKPMDIFLKYIIYNVLLLKKNAKKFHVHVCHLLVIKQST